MMEGYGYQRKKAIHENPARYLKMNVIITWKGDTLRSATLYRVMWLPGPLRNAAMQVMVLGHQARLCTSIIQMLLTVMEKRRPGNRDRITRIWKQSEYLEKKW